MRHRPPVSHSQIRHIAHVHESRRTYECTVHKGDECIVQHMNVLSNI